MYGPIDTFSITLFLGETYPTEDDAEAKQNVIDYLAMSLSKCPHVGKSEMDHFMETFAFRINAISKICRGVENMDDCQVDVVSDIGKSIDADLSFIIKNKSELIHLSGGVFFLDVTTIPDAVKFYKYLLENKRNKYSISRKQLENLYNDCDFGSPFSNVLFSMSWLGFLRVYNSNLIYFNQRHSFYF